MKFMPGILIIYLLLFGLSSCQKEVDGSLPVKTTGDSTVLWKYVIIDTTLTPGLDTLEVFYFKYDAQKRLSRLLDSLREDTSSSPAYTYSAATNFFYNGSETKPYKSIKITREGTDFQWDTSYYTYQGQLLNMDSTRTQIMNLFGTSKGITARYFMTNMTSVTMIERLYQYVDPNPPGPACESNYNIGVTYVNGNLATENATSTGCTISAWDKQFSYDNKTNPFYTAIPLHYPITGFSDIGNNEKNNMVDYNSTSMGFHFHSVYTYRSNGLPSIVRLTDLMFPQYSYKGLYYYQN